MNKNTLTIGRALTQHGRINKTTASVSLDHPNLYTSAFFCLFCLHERKKKIKIWPTTFPTTALHIFRSFFFSSLIYTFKRDQNQLILAKRFQALCRFWPPPHNDTRDVIKTPFLRINQREVSKLVHTTRTNLPVYHHSAQIYTL